MSGLVGGLLPSAIKFLAGGLSAFSSKQHPAVDTPAEAQQRQAPVLAATAARDEQALTDQTAQVTAERTSDEAASRSASAVGDAERRSVRESSADLQRDPDLPFRD